MKKHIFAVFLLGHAALTLSADGEWSGVEKAIVSGNATVVYEQLRQQERQRAGDPQFDYWFGLAALEAGQPARATLAFERVLARDPSHTAARLDMGRAFYALGNHARARDELTVVLNDGPPPAARATIERYLALIEARALQQRGYLAGYAEAGFGRDSNVTVGPRQSSVFLPGFGADFSLGPNSRQSADNYAHYALGGEFARPVSERGALIGGADLKLRDYRRMDAFDNTSLDARLGYQHAVGADTFRALASYNDYRLESDRYRRTTTFGGDWRRRLGNAEEVSVFGQVARLTHANELLKSNDVNQWLLGAGWVRPLSGLQGLTLVGTAFVGAEREINERADGNKQMGGVRFGALHATRSDLDLFAALGLQAGRYDRVNALYDQKRSDTQVDLQLGAAWRFAPSWSLRPSVTYTRNDSNLSIDDYRRYDVNVVVRRDFR